MTSPPITSKSDRDRIRRKAAGTRRTLDAIRSVVRDYAQGRSAPACMAAIITALKDAVDA